MMNTACRVLGIHLMHDCCNGHACIIWHPCYVPAPTCNFAIHAQPSIHNHHMPSWAMCAERCVPDSMQNSLPPIIQPHAFVEYNTEESAIMAVAALHEPDDW